MAKTILDDDGAVKPPVIDGVVKPPVSDDILVPATETDAQKIIRLTAEVEKLKIDYQIVRNSLTALQASSDIEILNRDNTITTLQFSLANLTSRLDSALLPYANEKRILNELGSLMIQSQTQLDTLNQLINDLHLDDNLSLMLSSFDYWIVNQINTVLSKGFEAVTTLINDQNDIENLKFTVSDQTIDGINIDNIGIYLISENQRKEISKSSVSQFGNVNILELVPDDFGTDTDYILYFTNKNFYQKDIPVRIYNFNNMYDLVVFKSLDSNIYNGNKLYLKQNNVTFYESLIYQQVTRGEHKILFVNRIGRQGEFTCDINIYEIEDFYVPFKYTQTDLDELQNYIVGKMIYDKKSNTQTYYDVDETTVLRILRVYLDPSKEQEIRIPTET